jgi:adenylate kinase family enzyme
VLVRNSASRVRVLFPVKKVLVIGSPGSGKSVFSRRLGEIAGLPVIHLDQHFWRPGWAEPSREEWDQQLEELLRRDSWIIDGNYSRTMEMRLRYCDTAIFLDFPRHLCTWRVFKRSLGLRGRPDLAAGCEERMDAHFLKWTWDYPQRSRPGVMKRLAAAAEKTSVVTLTTNREVEEFLSSLASKYDNENGN